MKLGVCYYPEQWPRTKWAEDAARMHALGLRYVRIGEFAWSRLEPEPGTLHWDWLDEVVELLHGARLGVVLGTPTATPPKWLVDRHPDILPVGADGRPRGFGSRRHYCFSNPVYRRECRRIVALLAERYGRHPAVVAWQTDNEYGCHATVLSYSPAAVAGFRGWLQHRYGGTIDALNQAWGTVFWSQEYTSFEQIDLPVASVTEANPAHRLDHWRFASEQVAEFNREQVAIIRSHSPGRDILHNYMGFFTDFDHYATGRDLDVAAWDSYPLGFLDQGWFDEADKQRYLRCGHPDFAAFHHDLYRGVGAGRLWVMEQQPGPVNWAPHNPAPLPGMVRLWTWEAFAHGAEVVAYFRWRQAPFGQEQMHAGLHLPDDSPWRVTTEVRRVAEELGRIPEDEPNRAPVALLFDYESQWLLDIQPHGASFSYLGLVYEFYVGLRRLGVDLDILPVDALLDGYRAVVIPSLPIVPGDLVQRLARFDGQTLFGPRSGSRTVSCQIPEELPPGPLQRLLPLRVIQVESLRPGVLEPVDFAGRDFTASRWRETIETDLVPEARFSDGCGALLKQGRHRYLAAWPEPELCRAVLAALCRAAGIALTGLDDGLRLRRRGNLQFAFNYGPNPVQVPATGAQELLLGGPSIAPGDVAAWRMT